MGVSRSELLERRVPDVVASPYQQLQRAALDAESGTLVTGETHLRRGDGSLVEVVYTTMPGRIGNLPVLVSFVHRKTSADLGRIVDVLMGAVRSGSADPRG